MVTRGRSVLALLGLLIFGFAVSCDGEADLAQPATNVSVVNRIPGFVYRIPGCGYGGAVEQAVRLLPSIHNALWPTIPAFL